YGTSLTKSQQRTKVHSEDEPSDYTQTRVTSKVGRTFYGFTLRGEVEHLFTPNIAVGIMQDLIYELSNAKTEAETLTRSYSGGVQTGTDDPSNTTMNSDTTDIRTTFQGVYLRIYF